MSSFPSTIPCGVQTDANGLILPKKLKNPCLESTDRKQLHRELKFNNKVGKTVLNQKSELQRAYEKQREKQQQQTTKDMSKMADHDCELNRALVERTQKHEERYGNANYDPDDEKQYVNPEYLNIRSKLRTGQRGEVN